MKPINLDHARAKMAEAEAGYAIVSMDWLKAAIAEIEASRDSFRSPIVVLDHREPPAHG